MITMHKYEMSVSEFLQQSHSGSIDYNDFIINYLEALKEFNKKLRLMQCINERSIKPASELYGLPITVKDNICTAGLQSSAGSRILQGYVPPFDATAVARLKDAGGFISGKTNMDEFGHGTFAVHSAYGIPKNPHDPERSCGGSSGGAAGVVAAVPFPQIALCESTGGSISCPAAFCNVAGLTPTYGLVSRYGLIDYANSLDKIGFIAKEVKDIALGLSIIAGYDKRDSTSLNVAQKQYHAAPNLKGVKIAVPKEYFENLSADVEKSVWDAIKKMESNGASYSEVSLPMNKYALASYYIIATSETSTNLAKLCGMRYGLHKPLEGNFNQYFTSVRTEGFGEEAKRRIILGTFARMSGYREQYYMKAMRVRTLITNDFKRIFAKHDVIAAPTMPAPAPLFSEIEKMSALQNYQMDVLTVPPNLSGIPMISVPCGEMIGLHLLGDHLQEEKILGVAAGYEMIR